MKFQFAQSSRVIEATNVNKFDVIQDNRKKTVHVIQYETSRGPSQITFLNGVEATLNDRGRYVQAKSKREDCAKILPDEEPKVEDTEE
jgi:hypothetical protein